VLHGPAQLRHCEDTPIAAELVVPVSMHAEESA
jgi:hypothetical protein